MGMSPLEGLIMGTRCGDIDPVVIEFICTLSAWGATFSKRFLLRSGVISTHAPRVGSDCKDTQNPHVVPVYPASILHVSSCKSTFQADFQAHPGKKRRPGPSLPVRTFQANNDSFPFAPKSARSWIIYQGTTKIERLTFP